MFVVTLGAFYVSPCFSGRQEGLDCEYTRCTEAEHTLLCQATDDSSLNANDNHPRCNRLRHSWSVKHNLSEDDLLKPPH